MSICIKCGREIFDEAKFCNECGAKVGTESQSSFREENTVYEGKIHKCRNCGEILGAFESVCPTCGYELRDTYSSDSVREFAEKMEQLQEHGKASSKNKIISLIRTFPIPNTKEDLFEFIILAGANIREDRYDDDLPKYKQEISDAWKAKFEQAYQKAKLSCSGDESFLEIEKLYQEKTDEQRKARIKKRMGPTIALVGVFGIIIRFYVKSALQTGSGMTQIMPLP